MEVITMYRYANAAKWQDAIMPVAGRGGCVLLGAVLKPLQASAECRRTHKVKPYGKGCRVHAAAAELRAGTRPTVVITHWVLMTRDKEGQHEFGTSRLGFPNGRAGPHLH
jgi:hypothetical protein